jgi:hypothetical protein
VEGKPLHARGDPSLGRVPDLQVVMDALLIEIDKLKGDPNLVPCLELTLVERVDLGREGGSPALLEIVLAKAGEPKALLRGPVEEHMVISHVHMAVIVDPSRRHSHRRRDERGKKEDWDLLLHDQCSTLVAVKKATRSSPRRKR